jgi:hypothetical protein
LAANPHLPLDVHTLASPFSVTRFAIIEMASPRTDLASRYIEHGDDCAYVVDDKGARL